MKIHSPRLPVAALLVCVLGLSACAGGAVDEAPSLGASSPTNPSASTTTAAPSPAQESASAIASPAADPSPTARAEPAVALSQSFTSPDGSLSFGYPADWTVTIPEGNSEEVKQWNLTDAAGERVLSLTVRPNEDMYKVSPPLTPTVIPQGQIPGTVDQIGTPTVAAVATSPGQSRGVNASVLYGMTSATGADPVFGDIRWGNGYLLSFSGHQMIGANDQVDMPAEAEQFAASARFRTQILPVLQSLTATPVPGETGEGTPGAPAPAVGTACAGVHYSYENLQGVTCQEAKAILQVVSDTGEPIGARGRRTAEYHCFWSSAGEREAGMADVLCRDRADGTDLFDGYYR